MEGKVVKEKIVYGWQGRGFIHIADVRDWGVMIFSGLFFDGPHWDTVYPPGYLLGIPLNAVPFISADAAKHYVEETGKVFNWKWGGMHTDSPEYQEQQE